jgi:DNA-damage-inducible protein J
MTASLNKKVRTNVYLDSDMKIKAQEVFKTYGIGLSDAFNMFLSQSVLERGIPFQIKIPNDVTLQAMKDVDEEKNLDELSLDEFKKEMDTLKGA